MGTGSYRDLALRPERTAVVPRRPDVICLSHLRWNFVFQRPQHLLTRCAKDRRVFFVEEPEGGVDSPRLDLHEASPGVHVAVPRLPPGLEDEQISAIQRQLLGEMVRRHAVEDYLLWYYTPMALPFTRHLAPRAVIYDCMDELSAFAGAPPALREHEYELLRRASLVLTGGYSLYEVKRGRHHNVHALPSSVDVAHFARAREPRRDPADQAAIPGPRLGYFGVIDERMDVDLLAAVAAARPDFHLVMLGPVVKIQPEGLPRAPNIHYLGKKTYEELPSYLGGWDVALMPFARNESTRFISPTKTPEYLAAGKPVVSTSIRDVVRTYGKAGLARIADTPTDFIAAVDACLAEQRAGDADAVLRAAKLERIDDFLAQTSWDRTWARIDALIDSTLYGNLAPALGNVAPALGNAAIGVDNGWNGRGE
jgi:glycosyltransferase involved in cell wall biosynthesis